MAENSKQQIFCPTCCENVDLYQAEVDDFIELRCVYCGQVLEKNKLGETKSYGIILTAEDSPLLREMLKDVLIEKKLTQEVQASENGQEVISRFTQLLRNNDPPGVVILDVIMPVINGFFTALALRGIEKGFQVKKPIPFIFLSSRDLDKNFENVIQFCQPCYYIQKAGDNEGPESLGKKIEEVIAKINT